MTRPVKRSLTIAGHRTSVSLEDAFWDALREIAETRGIGMAALVTEIDRARALEPGEATGLATAIRLHVLAHFRARASEAAARSPDGASSDP